MSLRDARSINRTMDAKLTQAFIFLDRQSFRPPEINLDILPEKIDELIGDISHLSPEEQQKSYVLAAAILLNAWRRLEIERLQDAKES